MFSTSAQCKDDTKWEVGVGIGSQFLADYRGSSHYQINVLPFPYLVHHGRYIEVDRDGVKGKLFRGKRVELDISLDAALTSEADDNDLREGMPELNSTVELGPSININLTGKHFDEGWVLRLPVRKVFALDFSRVDEIGYVFNPRLTWRQPDVWQGWSLSVNAGAVFADSSYHEYFYSVTPQFATATRPVYQAERGFSGYYFKASMKKKTGPWWLGAYVRYDSLSDAAFKDSPLFENEHYAALGLGVARRFWVF